MTGMDGFFSIESNDDDDIVVIDDDDDDDDEDDELDRLLLVDVEFDRFRFERLSFFDELKRMSKECQDGFIICHYSHPFDEDFRRFGDRDERFFFEDFDFDGRFGPYSIFLAISLFYLIKTSNLCLFSISKSYFQT